MVMILPLHRVTTHDLFHDVYSGLMSVSLYQYVVVFYHVLVLLF